MDIPINTIITLTMLVGVVFLQISLSKRRSKWLGLILPTITFSLSLLSTLLIVANFAKPFTVIDITIPAILVFFLWNIPTIINMGIYLVIREKVKLKHRLPLRRLNMWSQL